MTSTWHRDALSIDRQLALRTAAPHPARESDGTFGAGSIEWFLRSSHHEFAGRAPIRRDRAPRPRPDR